MDSGLSILKRVPPTTMTNVLRSCAIHRNAGTEAISRSSAVGVTTAAKTLSVLAELGLTSGDKFSWTCEATDLNRASDDRDLTQAIRSALLAYRPLEMLCEGLVAGESISESTRHTAVALGLDSKGESYLDLLTQWGIEFGILTLTDDGTVFLAEDLQSTVKAHAAMPIETATSNVEARLYVSTILGRDAFDELDEVDRHLFARAVVKCDTDPADSVEASGQALEDYLRELCGNNGLSKEASALNGAGQLANLLRKQDLIHPHHLKLVDAVSMMRNAKAHKKDKKTVAPWTVTAIGARTTFGAAAISIKSIHEWVTHKRQVL